MHWACVPGVDDQRIVRVERVKASAAQRPAGSGELEGVKEAGGGVRELADKLVVDAVKLDLKCTESRRRWAACATDVISLA